MEETWRRLSAEKEPSSSYLVACEKEETERFLKQLLYELMAPVFLGEKKAGTNGELAALFASRYGIDVQNDFYEGDEHYDEYREAEQAIAEGMSIYGGEITFGDCDLADLADKLWENLEQRDPGKFRRINTMLEE